MAGDTIQAAVRSFYKRQSPQSPKTTVPAEQMLAGLLQAFTAPQLQSAATHGLRLSPETRMAGPGLTVDDLKQLKNNAPNSKQLARPKAYLNYVFFDKQLNVVLCL